MRRFSKNLSTRAPAPKRRRTTARKPLGLLAVGAMAIPGAVFLLPQASQAALPAGCVLDTPTGIGVTCTYNADPALPFTVPAGVTSVTAIVQGAAGANATAGGGLGGRAAVATATFNPVAAGAVFTPDVAPATAAAGGIKNAGGAGGAGGAASILTLDPDGAGGVAVADVVAAGGGGGAGDSGSSGGNGATVAGPVNLSPGGNGVGGAGGTGGTEAGRAGGAGAAIGGGGGGGGADAANTASGGGAGGAAGGGGGAGDSFGPANATYVVAPVAEAGKITLKYNACRSAQGVSLTDASVTEGNAGTVDLAFTVTLAAASNCGGTTVTVQTDPSPIPPSATAGQDYVTIGAPGLAVAFLAGEASKVVNVKINGDATAEPDEFLLLSVVDAITAPPISDVDDKVTITRGVAAGKIVNDDGSTLASPTIAGTASANVALGGSVTDSATVTGRVNAVVPAGITFRLYGPNDPGCVGTPVFTQSVAQPVANGPVSSGPFTPTVPGDYLWRAFYSGDANNNPVATPCGAAGQSVTVTGFAALSTFSCGGSPATHVIRANATNRTLSTGSGRQVIVVEGGGATVNSGSGSDAICGGPGNDNINAGSGNDFIRGNGGDDTINAGSGVNDVG